MPPQPLLAFFLLPTAHGSLALEGRSRGEKREFWLAETGTQTKKERKKKKAKAYLSLLFPLQLVKRITNGHEMDIKRWQRRKKEMRHDTDHRWTQTTPSPFKEKGEEVEGIAPMPFAERLSEQAEKEGEKISAAAYEMMTAMREKEEISYYLRLRLLRLRI